MIAPNLVTHAPYTVRAMDTIIRTEEAPRWSYRYLRDNPGKGFAHFRHIMEEDPRLRGRVLDIGCGAGPSNLVGHILGGAAQWDGLDPSEAVHDHPSIVERWHCPLEEAPVPEGSYDAAIAWLVLEHVADPPTFMRAAIKILKPGGAFFAATPHAHHPFAWLSRGIELVGLKSVARDQLDTKVNDYPAYYRANSVSAMRRACRGLPVSQISAWRLPALNWALYFPRVLRWGPGLYDRLIQTRFPGASQLIMFRIERGVEPPAEAER